MILQRLSKLDHHSIMAIMAKLSQPYQGTNSDISYPLRGLYSLTKVRNILQRYLNITITGYQLFVQRYRDIMCFRDFAYNLA